MAQRKIVWSHRARLRLKSILQFYIDRNGSKTYSEKLFACFNQEIRLLINYPNLGIQTDFANVRGLIVNEFIIYYELMDEQIFIHTIWDSRQDPDSLIIK